MNPERTENQTAVSRQRVPVGRRPGPEMIDPTRHSLGDGFVCECLYPDRVRIPAWMASVALHATLFVLLALIWRHLPAKSIVSAEPDRKAGVALVEVRGSEERYLTNPNHAPQAPADTQASGAQASLARIWENEGAGAPVELPSAPAPLTGSPSSVQAFSSGGDYRATGRPQRGLGGKGRTSVFGAEGVGTRFVYVFDRSGSMDGFGGRPLAAAKAELLASLAQLDKTHQFQIVFYNERPSVFNPYTPQPPRLLFADEAGKRLAESFVAGITATGGSHHYEALRLALQMQPDVVFFLTDGQENPPTSAQLESLLRQASRCGATIHAIEFGAGPGPGSIPFLRQLASATGGRYVYIDVTRLVR